jgi:hypothetical protein
VSRARRLAALGLVLAGALPASPAAADSFTPVRLGITVAPVARRHVKLPITVQVSADRGALDSSTSPLWIQVKLASECGGTFQYTPGTVLLDKRLDPQPSVGRGYSASFRGSGRPAEFGAQTVCVFLNEAGDQRTFASDQSTQVDVSRPCTLRAARYDRARKALRRARRHRHKHERRFRRARRRAAKARKRALRACGPGVRL